MYSKIKLAKNKDSRNTINHAICGGKLMNLAKTIAGQLDNSRQLHRTILLIVKYL